MVSTNKFRLELIIIILLATTAILWVAHTFFFNRILIISPQSDFPINLFNDTTWGGKSECSFAKHNDKWIFNYELKEGSPYPFCVFQIDIRLKDKGRDLSQFSEVVLWTKYEGVGNGNIRLDLRNDNPDYTKEGDIVSYKYNEIQYPPNDVSYPLTLHWQDFQVPNWWIAERNTSLIHRRVDVTNIVFIEFVSGEKAPIGKGSIEISRIEFRGKWISSATFYMILLWLWIITWSIVLFTSLRRLKGQLKIKEKQRLKLLEINQMLSIERDKLKWKAKRDELTELLNRYGIFDEIEDFFLKGKKTDEGISVIFISIDSTSKDTSEGTRAEIDKILKSVANLLEKEKGESDMIARWGIKDFLILGQASNDLELLSKTKHFCSKIFETIPKVSFHSGGIRGNLEHLQELLEKAGQILISAKAIGQNQIIIETPEGRLYSPATES